MVFSEEFKFLCIVQDIFAIGTVFSIINGTRDLNIPIMFKNLFLNISIFLGNCQFKIVPFKRKISGIKGGSLMMQWNMINRVDYLAASLYLGNNDNTSQLLYQKTVSTLTEGSRLVSHFKNRSRFTVIDNSFRVTITNLQYSDEASYLLTVVCAGFPPEADSANITIVNVEGKHKVICF